MTSVETTQTLPPTPAGITSRPGSALTDDLEKRALAIDVSESHEYAVVWEPGLVDYFVDGRRVERSDQAPAYAMQLMLNIHCFAPPSEVPAAAPFVVERVAVYRPAAG